MGCNGLGVAKQDASSFLLRKLPIVVLLQRLCCVTSKAPLVWEGLSNTAPKRQKEVKVQKLLRPPLSIAL